MVVNQILHTLKPHVPGGGQKAFQELTNIALRFEEKIYTIATSLSDYMSKIAYKMLKFEGQIPMINSIQSNSANNGQNPLDPGSQSMQSQLNSQVPPLPVPLPTNLSQSQMTQLQQSHENHMHPEMYNPSSPYSWVSNTQQSTTNFMDPVEQLVDLFNKIL